LSRIPGATHLHNDNLMDFLRDGDPDRAVVVYCYHGHASQSAAALLAERGFDEVYSMDGGFEQWRTQYPVDSETRS
jgi:thiosulfate sulfurtransferase